MNITVATICRNEIEYLPYSLGIAQWHADKVIVVFTGLPDDPNYKETRDWLYNQRMHHPNFIIIEQPWTGCHATARRQYTSHLLDGWFWMIDSDEIWYRSMIQETLNYLPYAQSDHLYTNEKVFKNSHFTCGHRYVQRVRWMKIDNKRYNYDIAGSHIADDLCFLEKNSMIKKNLMPPYNDSFAEYAGGNKCKNKIHYLHFSQCSKHRFNAKDVGIEWPAKDLLTAFPGPYPLQCKNTNWLSDAGVLYSNAPPHYLVDPYFENYSWDAKNARLVW